MKKFRIPVLILGAMLLANPVKAAENVKIGKQNIKLSSNLMTPEALWAMGRIGAAEASADGKQIVYQVGSVSLLLPVVSVVLPVPSALMIAIFC